MADTKAPKLLLRAQKLAHLSDSRFTFPFSKIRFGWDNIIGLIPGIGDLLMLLVSAYIVILAKQLGLPRGLLILMIRNCLIDFVLGLLPLLGDLFDIFYKANTANVKIMQNWWLSTHKNALQNATQSHLQQWQSNHQD
jgi:hypothetical protein